MRHIPSPMSLILCLFMATLLLTQCQVPTEAVVPLNPLATTTKEAPFVNSLGMKFVPVPGTNILMCTTETSVQQMEAGGWVQDMIESPISGKFPGGRDAVSGIDRATAHLWCARLSQREGRRYRMPTNAEWDAATGVSSLYPWGATWPPPTNFANYMGQESKVKRVRAYVNAQGLDSLNAIKGFQDPHFLRRRWEVIQPMRSASTTCLAMSGSGWRTHQPCVEPPGSIVSVQNWKLPIVGKCLLTPLC
ncbi:sulfatase-modifying factor enzyme 1 [Prosthecobacter fusiformis]|uniref:Sulfatase-modifying factor enzyme 1 n=1 Tax=Prosthecobacter fusiformis TaxID=48464 RepID=A0A4R7RR74_9BACT|nr:sulfatase-modifying factor enzyme 1 [Prosthecobacter fusiformis]